MKYLLLIFIVALSLPATTQSFEVIHKLPVSSEIFSTDNLGNIYAAEGDMLKKYTPDGRLLNTYNNKSYGEISYVDATNPLRVVVWYRDLSQVVFLDNTLSDHPESVQLSDLGFDQAAVVCGSVNNGIWLYDPSTQELVWIDKAATVQKRSGSLIQQLGLELNPNWLIERNNWVYLGDPEHGIFVFDIFGTYYKTLPFKKLDHFDVERDVLYYLQNNQLDAYELRLGNEAAIDLPTSGIKEFRYTNKRFFFRLKGAIWVCRQRE